MRYGYLFAALTFVLPAPAAEMYTFSYTRTSGPILSFSFSFSTAGVAQPPANAGGFLTGNGGFTINSFMVSGSSTYTLTQGRVDFDPINNDVCFTFGSAGVTLNTSCGPTKPPSESTYLIAFKPPPGMTGTFTNPFALNGQFGASDLLSNSTGSATLMIADVVSNGAPEPSSIFLAVTGLAGLAWMMRRRTRAVRDRSA